MVTLRLRQWFILLAATVVTAQPACSSKAVGVEECRRIEYARCEAAPACPDEFNVKDVNLCKLFYRDHCLHGLPVSTAPKSSLVNACVGAIRDLSACALELGATTAPALCSSVVETTDPKVATVCGLLAMPEAIPACGFLVQDADSTGGQGGGTSQSSTGGAGGAAGSSGGTGGTSSDPYGFGGLGDLLGIGGIGL